MLAVQPFARHQIHGLASMGRRARLPVQMRDFINLGVELIRGLTCTHRYGGHRRRAVIKQQTAAHGSLVLGFVEPARHGLVFPQIGLHLVGGVLAERGNQVLEVHQRTPNWWIRPLTVIRISSTLALASKAWSYFLAYSVTWRRSSLISPARSCMHR